MRSLVPWVLLGVLVAATRAAGTAHFTSTTVSTSRVADLRGSSSGYGVVDFVSGSVRVTDVSHTVEYSSTHGQPMRPSVVRDVDEEIDIGSWSWQLLGGSWIKNRRYSNPDPLGLADAGGVLALSEFGGTEPVVGGRPLGRATVDGVATTRYLVAQARPRPCGAAQAAFVAGNYVEPMTLWVDGNGRLVQVRETTHIDLTFPASLRDKFPPSLRTNLFATPTGAFVMVATLHMGNFGAPVHITPPPPSTGGSSSSSFSEMQIKGTAQSHSC